MRFAIADLPPESTVVTGGGYSEIEIGEVKFRCQSEGDYLILFPDRSVKQRDFLKSIGKIVD